MTPFDIDIQTLLALNFDGGSELDAIFYFISAKLAWVWLYGAVMWWVIYKHGWKVAAMIIVAMAAMILCADQTATLFKTYLPKLRPSHNEQINDMVHTVYNYKGGAFGTVSSHAANSIAFAIFSAKIIQQKWYNIVIGVWVVAVSYSRIYLGVHYPIDITAGLIEGSVWAMVWWKIFVFAKKKLNI